MTARRRDVPPPRRAYAELAETWGLGGLVNALDDLAKPSGVMPREAFELGIAAQRYLRAFPVADRSSTYRPTPCPAREEHLEDLDQVGST